MLKDYLKFSFNSLIHRRLRSWLTVIGIFIGIAAVVALIGVGQGLQSAISEQFEALGADKINIQPGAEGMGPPGTNMGISTLTDEDIEVIEKTNGVEKVFGYVFKVAKQEYKGEIRYGYVMGLPTEKEAMDIFSDAQGYKIIEGRNLKEGDNNVAVIGYNIANGKGFDQKVKVGNRINIEGKELKIVGSLDKIGNPYDDGAIIVPLETAKEVLGVENDYGYIIVKVKNVNEVDAVAEEIKKDLRKSRGLKEGEEDFRVETTQQLMDSFNEIFGIVTAVFVGIAAISLLVGGIGIMNTMYTSVLERTKEIGIMKAIGAKNKDIFILFFIESGLLGLVGGILGILLGIGIGKAVEFIAAQAIGGGLLQTIFPWWLIVGALAFGFIVGSIAGTLPALQASKMKPVDALRYE